MVSKPSDLPADLASAYLALLSERAMLQAERDLVVAERDVVAAERDTIVAERDIAVAQAANAQAMLSDTEALIVSLELAIEKLRRELRGQRSERTARLIDQMELQLEELVMAATEDEVAAQAAAARTSSVRSFTRKRPVRKPWPEDAERERVVIDPPTVCACCGGSRLSKLGEDVNETLEEIPRRFKVIETIRENRDDSGEIYLPRLRGDQPGASTVPCATGTVVACHAARLHRSASAGDDRLRQIWDAQSAEPPEHKVQM